MKIKIKRDLKYVIKERAEKKSNHAVNFILEYVLVR